MLTPLLPGTINFNVRASKEVEARVKVLKS
jgi:hypothetical protein